MEHTEADVTINGTKLNFAQSMTLRVALNDFLMTLSDPEYAEALGKIAEGYQARALEILRVMTPEALEKA